jgi:hypothetical protein
VTASALNLGSLKQPRVFVVQEPLYKDNRSGEIRQKFSLEPAKDFGDLVYVLNWSDPSELSAQQMLWKVRRELETFHRQDYLLMVGNPTAMALCAVIAAEETEGCFQLLYWDNKNGGQYRVETVDVNAQPL